MSDPAGSHKVSELCIERAWIEVCSGSAALLLELNDTQPAIAEMLGQLSQALRGDAADLLYFLHCAVWRACSHARSPKPLNEVSAIVLENSILAAKRWAEEIASSSADAVIVEKKLRDFGSYSEPPLMAFVTEAILEAGDDELELTPEEESKLLIASKALVDVLVLQL